MFSTTFVNQNSENNIIEKGRESLDNFLTCLIFWQTNGMDLDSYEYNNYSRSELIAEFAWLGKLSEIKEKVREVEEIIKEFQTGCGDFTDYGLCFDFVEANEEHNGFYRYQLSWGGPSSEVRFYPDGTIEYVFLDWFCGVGFNVTKDENFRWLWYRFKDLTMLDFDSKDYEELYQEAHIIEDEEEN